MSGYLLLEGGAEFTGRMAEVDRYALQLAGGRDTNIVIIPAAAAPDHNDLHAGANGVRWFEKLGARNVVSLPVIDPESASQPNNVQALGAARLIFLLGGFPAYLCQTLSGSLGWQAVLAAYRSGAVIGGSSAGAMVLCERFFDPETDAILPGLNLLPHTCCLPHYDVFGQAWAPRLAAQMPEFTLVGIDEQTGLVSERAAGGWSIYGRGRVTIYQDGRSEQFDHKIDQTILPIA